MKCFSIDLDGTLLDSHHQISDKNWRVVKKLHQAGHMVIINTGRAFEDVIKFPEVQELKTPIFCINGTVLYSKEREVLFEATFPIQIFREILPIFQELGLWVMVYTNQGGFPCRYPDIQDLDDHDIEPIFANYHYDQIFEKPDIKIYKVMAVSRKNEIAKIEEAITKIDGKYQISIAPSRKNNVELTSNEANKGKAIERFQELTNTTFSEIFAFGDGGNDVPQFKVATTSIAMANSPKEVQLEADLVTKTNDEDGFAYAVEKLLYF